MNSAVAVRCPHCLAMPGSPCRVNSRRDRSPDGGTHTARVNAYEAQVVEVSTSPDVPEPIAQGGRS